MTDVPHDALFKAVFESPDRAAELLRCMLPAALVEQIDWDSLALQRGSFVDHKLRESHTDLLFAARRNGRNIRIYFLLEHKSSHEGWVGLALHRYMGNIWDNFLRRTRAVDKLPPILPVVIYHSQYSWTSETEFSRLVDLPDALEVLRAFTPKFQFVLVDLASADPAAMAALGISPITQLAVRALNETRVTKDPAAMWESWRPLLEAGPPGPAWNTFLTQLLWYVFEVRGPDEFVTLNVEIIGETQVRMTIGDYLQKSRQEGLRDGHREGRLEGLQQSLLKLLRIKFAEVPPDRVERVESADPGSLERWLERILTAGSLDEVFAESAR